MSAGPTPAALRAGLVAAALLVTGCLDTRVPLEGKRCNDQHPCPAGLVCNPFTSACATDAGCPTAAPAVEPACARTELWASSDGAGDGSAADRPARLPALSPFAAGARVHLAAGDYPGMTAASSGTGSCPVEWEGALDGGARFVDMLTLTGSHWRLAQLSFAARDAGYALKSSGAVADVRLADARFTDTAAGRPPNANEYPFDVYLDGQWADWTVERCAFVGTRAPAFFADRDGHGLTFQANTVTFEGDGPAVQIEAGEGLVRDNEFTGAMANAVVEFVNGGSGRVERNVFHDLATSGVTVVKGASQIVSNTFVHASPTTRAADCGAFRDNLVSGLSVGVGCNPSSAGFNLFDAVAKPYPDGQTRQGDLQAAPALEAGFVPSSQSPALDAADPQLPVPLGGGSRADIGARERGATRLDDGSYCWP